MSNELKEKLLREFPGKMENEQAFIIQFIMNEAQQGNKPPSKDDINNCIKKMIKEGIFQKKGPLFPGTLPWVRRLFLYLPGEGD